MQVESKCSAQIETELVKIYQKGFFRSINKQKENICTLSRRGKSVINTERQRCSTLLHICLYHQSWASGLMSKNPGWCNLRPIISEERVGKWTKRGAWPLQIGGPWQYPPNVRELADVIVRLLSIIFQKSWRSGDIPEDWMKANVIAHWPMWAAGQVTEWIFLGAITGQKNDIAWEKPAWENGAQPRANHAWQTWSPPLTKYCAQLMWHEQWKLSAGFLQGFW